MRSELLFIVRVNPDNRQATMEVLSEIMTFAAFDVPLRLLFLDRGVRLLSSEIDPQIAGMMMALPLYGVADLFVERESLDAIEIASSALNEQVISVPRSEISRFIFQHKGVMGV
ncbi:MAG: sulfurtransferase complex subunit TusC [Pseudomonadota bacterium]|jgi:sulfur relay (sulfurtransferase) DsrF/TusC family protein